MILPAHDFRSHIPRRPTGLFRIIRVPYPCDPEVCDPQVSLMIKDQVLWLNIPVDDALIMDILKRVNYRSYEKPRLFLRKLPVSRDVVTQITPT